MDSYTFGGTKAAVVLAKILTKRNDRKLNSIITRTLTLYNSGLNEIDKINTLKVKKQLLVLWYKNFNEGTKRYDEEVGNFLRNVISAEFKKRIKIYK